jgi:hypothetical protein
MLRDITNNLDLKRALSPVSVGDNTAQVTQILDTRDYGAVMLAVAIGSVADADATFAVTFEDGDAANLSDAAAVAAAYLNGTTALAGFQFDDDNEARKIGYTGNKRYIRATITPSANASAALLSALWIGMPYRMPAANPPA